MQQGLSKVQEQTRRNIFDAYAMLQINKRFEAITVREICEKAGYNKSTFYNYFSDVYDLRAKLEEMLIQMSDDGRDVLTHKQPVDTTEELVSYFDYFYQPNRLYLRALWGKYGDPEYTEMSVDKIKEHLLPLMKEVGISGSDEYVGYLVDFYSHGHIACIKRWFSSEGNISSEDIVRILQTIKYDGILSIAKKRAEMNAADGESPAADRF